MTVDLTTTVSGNATVDITVFEDTDQDGIYDNKETVTVSGGTNTYSLTTVSGGTGHDYWVSRDYTTNSVTDEGDISKLSLETETTTVSTIATSVETITVAGLASDSGYPISGTVTLNNSSVSGATVRVIDQDTDSHLGTRTTDTSGNYRFLLTTSGTMHVTVEYESGNTKYNAKSKPFVIV